MTARPFLWRLIGILGWIAPVSILIGLRAFVPWDEWLAPLLSWLGQTGWIGMVCAIALYVPLGLLLVPASALTVLIGVAHGFWSGMLCATLGANLAAWAGFALARAWKLGAGHTSLQQRNLILRINQDFKYHEIWLVLLARLSIFVPFGPLNYGMGLSKVGIKNYMAGTFWACCLELPCIFGREHHLLPTQQKLGTPAISCWPWALFPSRFYWHYWEN